MCMCMCGGGRCVCACVCVCVRVCVCVCVEGCVCVYVDGVRVDVYVLRVYTYVCMYEYALLLVCTVHTYSSTII